MHPARLSRRLTRPLNSPTLLSVERLRNGKLAIKVGPRTFTDLEFALLIMPSRLGSPLESELLRHLHQPVGELPLGSWRIGRDGPSYVADDVHGEGAVLGAELPDDG